LDLKLSYSQVNNNPKKTPSNLDQIAIICPYGSDANFQIKLSPRKGCKISNTETLKDL
jgi:hypothetical protein